MEISFALVRSGSHFPILSSSDSFPSSCSIRMARRRELLADRADAVRHRRSRLQRRFQPSLAVGLGVSKFPVFHYGQRCAGNARLLHHFAGNAVDFRFLVGSERRRGLGFESQLAVSVKSNSTAMHAAARGLKLAMQSLSRSQKQKVQTTLFPRMEQPLA